MSTYEDPGVAFRETIVPVAHFDSDWTTRPCNSVWSLEKPQRAGVTRPGPRPLVAMAMTVVTRNITRDSESAFTSLNAPRILEQIWANIEDWPSFDQWRIFSKTLPPTLEKAALDLYRYHYAIPDPTSGLAVYTTPLTAPNCDFITSLTIDRVTSFRSDEFVALASLPNLGVLDIFDAVFVGNEEILSDRLVRGWSEVPNAFPALRILSLCGGRRLSPASLDYVSKFPMLGLYILVGRLIPIYSAEELAATHGWKLQWPSISEEADTLSNIVLTLAVGTQICLGEGVLSTCRELSSMHSNGKQTIEILDRAKSGRPTHKENRRQTLRGIAKLAAGDKQPEHPDTEPQLDSRWISFAARSFWLHSILSQMDPTPVSKGQRAGYIDGIELLGAPFASLHLGRARYPSSIDGYFQRTPGTNLYVLMRSPLGGGKSGLAREKTSSVTSKRVRGDSATTKNRKGESGTFRPRKAAKLSDLLASLGDQSMG